MSFDATKSFRLNNIRLGTALFTSDSDVGEMVLDLDDLELQTRQWCNPRTVKRIVDDEEKLFLIVEVNIGLRLMNPPERDEAIAQESLEAEPKIIYTIEAKFLAEFEIIDEEFSKDDYIGFVEKNASHVVWPFWRQHVSATLNAASLPVLQIPLMASVKGRGEDVYPAEFPHNEE